MKKVFILAVIGLVSLAGGVVIGYVTDTRFSDVGGEKIGDTAIVAPAEEKKVAEEVKEESVTEFETYTNQEAGISFQYPKGWKVSPVSAAEDDLLIGIYPSQSDPRGSLAIGGGRSRTYVGSSLSDIKAELARQCEQLSKLGSDCAEVAVAGDIIQTAHGEELMITSPSARAVVIIVARGGKFYEFVQSAQTLPIGENMLVDDLVRSVTFLR